MISRGFFYLTCQLSNFDTSTIEITPNTNIIQHNHSFLLWRGAGNEDELFGLLLYLV